MLQSIKRSGFTLIELLVVITIIGILATGATTVYTSQIQRARDTTRVNDLKSLQSAIQQVYQQDNEFPGATTFESDVSVYMSVIPKDKKHGQTCNNTGGATDCAYTYRTAQDANGIDFGFYEVSTGFESTGNINNQAANTADNGNDGARLELGVGMATVDSSITTTSDTAATTGSCLPGGGVAGSDTVTITINGTGTCS